MRYSPPSRDMRLKQLKAFGLFIHGQHTLYQIAEAIGIADQNPSTAAGRARTKIEQGWRIICERKVARWERYWSTQFPRSAWQTLHGARLWTHPRVEPSPPPTPPTPFEQLLTRIEDVEREAHEGGFHHAATGLRNLRVALRYNRKETAQGVDPKEIRR
jgi:hypothetical protein